MQSRLTADVSGAAGETPETELRTARWRMFLYLFAATCLAVGLDVITTYMGMLRIGSRFEQNGIALYLITHIGWLGLTALLAIACALCVVSFKLVYWNLSLQWSRWLNLLVGCVCIFRWLVVTTDIIWLVRR